MKRICKANVQFQIKVKKDHILNRKYNVHAMEKKDNNDYVRVKLYLPYKMLFDKIIFDVGERWGAFLLHFVGSRISKLILS